MGGLAELVSPEEILLHILNMIILFLLLRKLLYKPVRKFMQERKEGLAASLEEAEQAHAKAEKLKIEYEARIADAEENARARALEITAAANASAKTMAESARAESVALLDKARDDARQERAKALDGMQQQVATLAVGVAERILQREVNKSDSERLAAAFFQDMEKGGEMA
ncbi:MAG: F0F1 ATP synthase subunit B [Oscillospiraceae bacterium]|jgi:F-type H+-transporting ATPase subunit b|nr:F0F1 ATP synthase subunit B [Oscillospiraceae bacterium]